MIKIAGSMTVRQINGRHGTFSVADLHTEIGQFQSKDTLLDQFAPGKYSGMFLISQIHAVTSTYGGRVVIETRAKLIEVFLDEQEHKAPDVVAPQEMDPIDEPASVLPAQPVAKVIPLANSAATASVPAEVPVVAGSDLFGELYADFTNGLPIKLDATVERLLFRNQRDALKAAGYIFNATYQTWSKPTS